MSENVKTLKFYGLWDELQAKIIFYRQPWTKYLDQGKEIK